MDILNFFRLDILQLVDTIKPFVLPIIWLVLPVYAFLRSTPIIGLVINRIPIFAAACIFANSVFELSLVVIIVLFFGFISDFIVYTKMYNFWFWFIQKIPKESKVKRFLNYFEKYPILFTLAGTYTAYTNCLITPFARHYEISAKKFWISRFLMTSFILILWASIWYFAKGLNDLISNIGLIIILFFVIALIINIFYSFKFLSQVKFFERIKKYWRK